MVFEMKFDGVYEMNENIEYSLEGAFKELLVIEWKLS